MSTTANYGWTKPTVGGDGDLWGGEINADLDGIDATVKSVSNAIPAASSATPVMDGTAAVGTGTTWARADHVHPTDTTRYAASNPSGYQTAAQVTAVVPIASSTAPVMDGTAAVGTGTMWARADHVHPSDTSRVAKAGDTMTGNLTVAPSGEAAIVVNKSASGVGAHLFGAKAGLNRWEMNLGNNGAESGSNAGSDFTLTRYDDSGNWVGVPFWIARSTGAVTIGNTLTLAQDPVGNLDAATKQYVDGVRYGDNRLINGDMRIDQRWNGASGTAFNVYTVDRWVYGATLSGKFTWQRISGPPNLGFPYVLTATSGSAFTPATTDGFAFYQSIEADMISDFAWGTSSAQPVTLSFWASSSLTGAFSGSIRNYASTRSYPFTFTIPTASAWTKYVVTIPGDTGGTWVMNGNVGSLIVTFDLGSGANNRGPANAWASASYQGATGAVSVVSTNGATFSLTGVKLEVGSIATPFNRQSLAKSLADCQRYYCIVPVHAVATAAGASNYLGASGFFPVQMRATPTVAFLNQIQSPANVGAATIDAITVGGFRTYAQSGAAGVMAFDNNYTASAEL